MRPPPAFCFSANSFLPLRGHIVLKSLLTRLKVNSVLDREPINFESLKFNLNFQYFHSQLSLILLIFKPFQKAKKYGRNGNGIFFALDKIVVRWKISITSINSRENDQILPFSCWNYLLCFIYELASGGSI